VITPKTLEEAMNSLLPADQRTGDLETDLKAALKESERRRDENSADGGAIIHAMRDKEHGLGWSWRQFTIATGMAQRSASHWLDDYREFLQRYALGMNEASEGPTLNDIRRQYEC
jgi:hypothetical protein